MGIDTSHLSHSYRCGATETIVEVGSWKGASAIHMAQTAGSLGLRPTVICIDTWLGTFEVVCLVSYSQQSAPRNGWPLVYYQFLANVVRTGYGEQIVPLPQTSQIGLRLIRNSGIKPELIYVDASHDYIDVKQDLETSWECVAEKLRFPHMVLPPRYVMSSHHDGGHGQAGDQHVGERRLIRALVRVIVRVLGRNGSR